MVNDPLASSGQTGKAGSKPAPANAQGLKKGPTHVA